MDIYSAKVQLVYVLIIIIKLKTQAMSTSIQELSNLYTQIPVEERDSLDYMIAGLIIMAKKILEVSKKQKFPTTPKYQKLINQYTGKIVRNKTAKKIIKFLWQKATFNKSIKTDLMDEYHFSEPTLRRFFEKYIGITPQHLHSIFIIEKASKLLLESETIYQVHHELDFGSLSNFNSLFKKIKGVSPTEFIKNTLKKF